ncbi:hypothetical protein NE236_13470 [Actinoallomurus purpureus]|uniref:hypothetical protein n=1 Tax=Actinoallomurus purpureus TaxID=478114 RepID=UPI002092C4DF|nr:hypothetical protein [Actinoallomurus purpureus]MCO6005996.1 hypothetical protein [Actinoallomurus purpureus]
MPRTVIGPSGGTRRPALQVSFDDGGSWATLPVEKSGTAWTATVRNPDAGYVSLRATADGVEQTLIRAYGVKSWSSARFARRPGPNRGPGRSETTGLSWSPRHALVVMFVDISPGMLGYGRYLTDSA